MRYLFIILSVVLFVALNNLYAQTGKWELNINGINQNNIEVDKLERGYHIYIQKKNGIAELKLKYKLANGSYSYLYLNSNSNSIININNTAIHDNLGYVFETYIPETLYLDSNLNTQLKLKENINLIFRHNIFFFRFLFLYYRLSLFPILYLQLYYYLNLHY